MLCSWTHHKFCLDVLGDFLVLAHALVSLPLSSYHFLYHSLGNVESRYTADEIYVCHYVILNKKRALFNTVCVVVEYENEFPWVIDHQQICSN
jgi:hypothetical protein